MEMADWRMVLGTVSKTYSTLRVEDRVPTVESIRILPFVVCYIGEGVLRELLYIRKFSACDGMGSPL
jgi:hypothetical protein